MKGILKNDTLESVSQGTDVRVLNHTQYAKSVLQQEDRYIPVAAAYSARGMFERGMIMTIIPTNKSGRDQIRAIMRTVDIDGTIFNESRLIKLLSVMGSSLLAYHRNSMRYMSDLKDYDKFGPLNYLRYITRVTQSIRNLRGKKGVIDYSKTVDSLLSIMVQAYSLSLAEMLRSINTGEYEAFDHMPWYEKEDFSRVSDSLMLNWVSNPDIVGDFHLTYRYIIEAAKTKTRVIATDLYSASNKSLPIFLDLADSAWDSINDFAKSNASAILDSIALNRKSVNSEKAAVDTNLESLGENTSPLQIHIISFLSSIERISDVGVAKADGSGLSDELLSSALKFKESNSRVRSVLGLTDKSDEDELNATIDDLVSNSSGVYARSIADLLKSVASSEADNDTMLSFQYTNDALSEVISNLGAGISRPQMDDVLDHWFSFNSALSVLLGDGNAFSNTGLVKTLGVSDNKLNEALVELNRHIDTIIEGRDSVKDYYANMDSRGVKAIESLPSLVREFDALCSSISTTSSKELASNLIDQFLKSETWLNSGAQKIYDVSFSFIGKTTDADSMLQALVIDDRVIDRFNQSAMSKFARIESSATLFPGHEFALGRSLTAKYEGTTTITGMSKGNFVINDFSGYVDIFKMIKSDPKDKETMERLSVVYNVKLQQCLSDSDVQRNVSRPSSASLSSNYNFANAVKDVALTRLQSIETAIKYDLACWKYSVKANIALYLLSLVDLFRSLKMAVKARELSFFSESGIERIEEMITESLDLVEACVTKLQLQEATAALKVSDRGIPPLRIGSAKDTAANLDSLLSHFDIKSNRIALKDSILNVARLVDRLDAGRADSRNFAFLVDIDSSIYGAEMNQFNRFSDDLERVEVDVLAKVMPNSALTTVVNDTTHRMVDRANFLYAVNLIDTLQQSKFGFLGDSNRFITKVGSLPQGINDEDYILPRPILKLLVSKVNSELSERYMNREDAAERMERLYLLKGPAVSAVMRFGTGYGEMAEFGLSNEFFSKVAYSEKDALIKVLEEVGLHPETLLYEFELRGFLEYIKHLQKEANFPLELNAYGERILRGGEYEALFDAQSIMRPKLSGFMIMDVISVKNDILRTANNMAGTVFHVSFYVRDENVLAMLNSDYVEFKSETSPTVLALSVRDGLQNFYIYQDEITLIEGHTPANIRYSISDAQALSVSVAIVESLFFKIFGADAIADSPDAKPADLGSGIKDSKLEAEADDLSNIDD